MLEPFISINQEVTKYQSLII